MDEFDPLIGEITNVICGCIIVEMPKDQIIFVDMEHCACGHYEVAATFDDEGFNSWPDQDSAQALP